MKPCDTGRCPMCERVVTCISPIMALGWRCESINNPSRDQHCTEDCSLEDAKDCEYKE